MARDNKGAVQLLLKKGFVSTGRVFFKELYKPHTYRADPTATGEDHRPAKKIAVENDSMDVVDVLWEALGEEVPEKVRLQQLSRAMYKEDKEEGRKRFRELLNYLTPDMVRLSDHEIIDSFETGLS